MPHSLRKSSEKITLSNLQTDDIGHLFLHHTPQRLQAFLGGRSDAVHVPGQHGEGRPGGWEGDTIDRIPLGEDRQLRLLLLAFLLLAAALLLLLPLQLLRVIQGVPRGVLALLRSGGHPL